MIFSNRYLKKILKAAVQFSLLGGLLALQGCSSDSKKADTAEGAFALAQEYEKADRFEEAIKRYQEVKNKFPYSKYATMAELALADVHFNQESFAEAQISYQNFRELHPKHPQSDYVVFRIGLSIYNQLPSTIDRDLSVAETAISYFNELLNQYPNSVHVAEATAKKKDTLDRLAQKELYIADFYFKKKFFESAQKRYERALKMYPTLGYDPRYMKGIALSAFRLGDLDNARKAQKQLAEAHPDSSERRSLDKEIGL